MYSIEDLQTFVQIAQRGGITAAAQEQGISPATVSHRLSKLERHLGVVLFHRSSRTVSLSVEGSAFLDRVQAILDDLTDAELEIGSNGGKLKGHLRVTMAPWIFSRFILPGLHALREAEPGLTFDFLTVDRFVNLVEEQQDCAIRVGALTDSSNLAKKLTDNRRILCAAPSYLECHGVPHALSDLVDHQAVCLPWQKDWGVGATMPRVAITVSNSDILTDAVTEGAGIAIKSVLAVASELQSGQLVEVLPNSIRSADAPISCLRPPKLKASRKVDAFVTFAETCFQTGSV